MPNKYWVVDGVATLLHHSGPTTLPETPPVFAGGEVVVCLHGMGGNGNVFSGLLEALGGDHGVLAFDQPGHGRSGSLDSLGAIERMADFTQGLFDKLGLGAPVLLGHGMGAAIALELALRSPERVRGLVLCSAGATLELPDEELAALKLVTEGKAPREFARDSLSKTAQPDTWRRAYMEFLKTDPRARYGDALACCDWSAEGRLADLKHATLVAVGADDRADRRSAAETLAGAIEAAELVTLADCAYEVPLEQPAALAEAVAGFLGRLDALEGRS